MDLHLAKTSTADHATAPRRDPEKSLATVVGLLLLVTLVQVWIVTAGLMGWPGYTDDYSRLATGFLHGELGFLIRPKPELLALSNPYDPALNGAVRWHDASLYHGRYYLYFGPVPALLIAAVSGATGNSTPTMGDQYLVFASLLGVTLLTTAMLCLIKARFFPRQPTWSLALPILSLGIGTPLLYMLARAAVYEAAIGAGQFFLLAGLLAAWFAVSGSRRRVGLLAAAGVCWALSAGSRDSLPPAIACVACLTSWQCWRREKAAPPASSPSPCTQGEGWGGGSSRGPSSSAFSKCDPHPSPLPEYMERGPDCARPRAFAPALLALWTPLLLSAAAMAWYNFARFGSIMEFGWNYQLQALNQHTMPKSDFVSPHFLLPNLLFYFFNNPHWMRFFPYLLAVGDNTRLANLFSLTRRFRIEEIVGMAWTQSFLIFAPLVLMTRRPQTSAAAATTEDSDARPWQWLTSCLAACTLMAFLPILFFGVVAMRYIMDAAPCATLLAAIGYWQIMERLEDRPSLRRALSAISLLTITVESLFAILLATTGVDQQFLNHNLRLYHALLNFFPQIPL